MTNFESSGEKFDREAEKEKRREIRAMLERSMSDTLRDLGFSEVKGSTWGIDRGAY